MASAEAADPDGDDDSDLDAQDLAKLADILRQQAKRFGTKVCPYFDDSPLVNDARLKHGKDDGIEACMPLLRKMHAVRRGLNSSRLFYKKALRQINQEMTDAGDWNMTKPAVKEWVDLFTNKLRNMCRVVSQAEMKSPECDWIQKMPWKQDGAAPAKKRRKVLQKRPAASEAAIGEADEEGVADEEGEAGVGDEEYVDEEDVGEAEPPVRGRASEEFGDEEWEFGIYPSTRLAFRRKRGTKRGSRPETSLPIEVPAGANGSDRVDASWPDGMKITTHITVDEFNAMGPTIERTGAAARYEVLYQTEKKDTGSELTIEQRVDRELLIAMKEQGKGILFVPARLFGPVGEDPKMRIDPSMPTIVKAIDFMVPICERFANGDLKRGDLIAARDAKLKEEFGYDAIPRRGTKPTTLKRPAACSDETKASTEAPAIPIPSMTEMPENSSTEAPAIPNPSMQTQMSAPSSVPTQMSALSLSLEELWLQSVRRMGEPLQ